jgi:PAS domain S-box-containing protein
MKKASPVSEEKMALDVTGAQRFCDVSQDLLGIANFDGYFTYVNPKFTQVLGYSAQEVLTTRFTDFIHPDDREATANELSKLSCGQLTFNFENRYRSKSGTYYWLLWNAAAFPDENIIFASARDITERKEMEQLKNDLVGVVSHELRTPLTSILGSLQMVAGKASGELSEDVLPLIQMAIRNAMRMQRMINEFLDIEKIESGKADFKMNLANLRDVVRDAVKSNEGFGHKHNVNLSLRPGIEALETRMDSDRIYQVVTNLISNAVKYSPNGGSVDISITKAEQSARVAVTDQGSGIPDEFKSRIFTKFAQARTGQHAGSSGLGLSICKAIVEQHGGRIGYDCVKGAGTTFFFDLPLEISGAA